MYCNKCGKLLTINTQFCPNCGALISQSQTVIKSEIVNNNQQQTISNQINSNNQELNNFNENTLTTNPKKDWKHMILIIIQFLTIVHHFLWSIVFLVLFIFFDSFVIPTFKFFCDLLGPACDMTNDSLQLDIILILFIVLFFFVSIIFSIITLINYLSKKPKNNIEKKLSIIFLTFDTLALIYFLFLGGDKSFYIIQIILCSIIYIIDLKYLFKLEKKMIVND